MKTARKFKITVIIITIALIYVLKEEITLGIIHLYAYTNQPFAHRVLGEIYSERSLKDSKKAAYHFQIALQEYKNELKLAPEDQKKFIQFIIGTHYECGRGTDLDLEKAKEWYSKAVDSGYVEGMDVLQRVNEALKEIEKNK